MIDDPKPAVAEPMPFDLWWSPSMACLLSRHENEAGENLVWVFRGNYEALRRRLGTGPDSNPPMPDDAVRLAVAPPESTCGAWGGCPQPVGHNRGRADIPENHGPISAPGTIAAPGTEPRTGR